MQMSQRAAPGIARDSHSDPLRRCNENCSCQGHRHHHFHHCPHHYHHGHPNFHRRHHHFHHRHAHLSLHHLPPHSVQNCPRCTVANRHPATLRVLNQSRNLHRCRPDLRRSQTHWTVRARCQVVDVVEGEAVRCPQPITLHEADLPSQALVRSQPYLV